MKLGALVDVEKLSKYVKKQPLLRQKLRAPHSAVLQRLEHAAAHEQGLDAGEVSAVLAAVNKILLSQAPGQLSSRPGTTPGALALLSIGQHLVLLLGTTCRCRRQTRACDLTGAHGTFRYEREGAGPRG